MPTSLTLKRGEIIQFERKGYYIYDNETNGVREFFKIPDGRAAGIASKAGPPAVVAAAVAAPVKAAEAVVPPLRCTRWRKFTETT